MNTSYFRNIKNINKENQVVSISLKAPGWYNGAEFKQLAPKYSFLKQYLDGVIDSDKYTEEYYKQVLSKLNPEIVYYYLIGKYGKDVTLLCYEKPGEFCHRRIVADWFEKNISDAIVKEL